MANEEGNWVFGLTDAREWEWRYRNRVTGADFERSSGTFAAFLDCMADAQRHGYRPAGVGELAVPITELRQLL